MDYLKQVTQEHADAEHDAGVTDLTNKWGRRRTECEGSYRECLINIRIREDHLRFGRLSAEQHRVCEFNTRLKLFESVHHQHPKKAEINVKKTRMNNTRQTDWLI